MADWNRPRIILDTDPGVDDAIAIITASWWADIVGITTVAGNVSVDHTTNNALRLRDLLGFDAPIHRGAERPLVGEPLHARHVHGATGLGKVDLPGPTRALDSEDAVGFLIESTRQEEGLHLVPVGPLTNVALALRSDPDLANRVASITLMGGGAGVGNVTPAAEFNIYADPEAANEVFRSGGPVTMVGLNLTHQVRMGSEHAEACRSLSTPAGSVAAELLDFNTRVHRSASEATTGAMHDPCAVLVVTHPDLFRCEPRHVTVELDGTHTRGQTLVDERGWPGIATNCEVAYGVDAAQVLKLIMQAIAEV
jgi:inosine-uridine nucleoside N-ribohydrolase